MRITKAERIVQFYRSMERIGIATADVDQLLRIERTLGRWFEKECGDSNQHMSWSIERDEKTEKPFMVYHPFDSNKVRREAIPDREANARKRLAVIMAKYPALTAYIQTDPRGRSLYIVPKSELIGHDGKPLDIDSVYTRGVAVC